MYNLNALNPFICGKIFLVSEATEAPNTAEVPVLLQEAGQSGTDRQTADVSWPLASEAAGKEEMS